MSGFEFMLIAATLQWVTLVTVRARGWPLYLRVSYLLSSFLAALVGVSAILNSLSQHHLLLLTIFSVVILNAAILLYVMMYETDKSHVYVDNHVDNHIEKHTHYHL